MKPKPQAPRGDASRLARRVVATLIWLNSVKSRGKALASADRGLAFRTDSRRGNATEPVLRRRLIMLICVDWVPTVHVFVAGSERQEGVEPTLTRAAGSTPPHPAVLTMAA